MDDQLFDEKSALEWSCAIEGSNSVRDTDIYPMLRSWLNQVSPRELLEIGCGQGICSDKIELEGRKYAGVEPSAFLLKRAKELYESDHRQFLAGNAYKLPFLNGAFDCAFSVAVWHLLSDLQSASAELSRVLRENGHFLIITANPGAYSAWQDLYTVSQLEGRRFEGQTLRPGQSPTSDILYFHTLDEIISALHRAKLAVHETVTFRSTEKSEKQDLLISIRGKSSVDNTAHYVAPPPHLPISA